jgi:hypothetical protein
MFSGNDYLVVETLLYGKNTSRAKIINYSTKSAKNLKLPLWYPPEKVDYTYGIRELSTRKKKYVVLPKSDTTGLVSRVHIPPLAEIPWQYQYEVEEPYSVKFGRAVQYIKKKPFHVHFRRGPRPGTVATGTDLISTTVVGKPKSILKPSKYKVSN